MRKSGDMIRDQVRILYLLFLWLIWTKIVEMKPSKCLTSYLFAEKAFTRAQDASSSSLAGTQSVYMGIPVPRLNRVYTFRRIKNIFLF
jgi:hypothetical protein